MKKIITLIMVMLTLVSVFAGGAKEEGPVTVTVWHSNAGEPGKAFDALVAAFNESHDDVKIEALYQGKANDVLTKVKSASITGSGLPDIAQLDATAGIDMMYSPFVVTPEKLGVDTSRILPQAMSAYLMKDGHIGIPFNSSALLFYYNRTLFEEAGIEAPETIDDMIEGAERMKALGVPYFAGIPTTYELCSLLGAQNGGSYLTDNQNGHMGLSTEVTFDDNGTFLSFLEKWQELAATGNIASVSKGTTDMFVKGQTASIFKSSSNLTTILKNVNGAFELGVAYVPGVDEDATGGVNIGGGALVAFDTKTDDEAVKTVLEYFVSGEAQLFWAEETGYLPVSMDTIESDEWKAFTDADPLFRTALEQVLDSSEDVTGLWIPSGFQVYYSFQETIGKVTDGTMTPEDAVAFMTDMIEKALEEYAATVIDQH